MGLPVSSRPDVQQAEAEILTSLLALYEEERQLYRRVLELSRRQGEIIRQGGSLGAIRRILEQKKACLETIKRLELNEAKSKQDWEKGRRHWSTAGKARLHATLQNVGKVIEEILSCEERNDMVLIDQAKGY